VATTADGEAEAGLPVAPSGLADASDGATDADPGDADADDVDTGPDAEVGEPPVDPEQPTIASVAAMTRADRRCEIIDRLPMPRPGYEPVMVLIAASISASVAISS
jgi:hypothetical protein